ncbi:MFS transporter [Bacillus sp. AFS031507]|uniref:MDR family MFS transporter n=1 Tax=Bacillus sp. AFS031507 TaxID=2033496 RepID=UPI000BFE984B|nr:MFS transporter [Bacillus sp. AFS031507]PGY11842.1 MFS transporter [Bacillus sp. AFS031507]
MSIWRSYPRNLKVLLLAMLVNSTGMAFLWPLHTIYMTQGMGKTLSEAGFVLMLHSGAEIVGSFLGGYLYDRIRGKRTLLLAVLTSASLIFIISIGLSWPMYILSMVLLGLGIGTIFPPIYALAGVVWKEGGIKSFNLIYLVLNFGVAVGTSLGGIVAQFSFQYVFWVNGFTYLLFIFIVWFALDEREPVYEATVKKDTPLTPKKEVRPTKQSIHSLFILCLGFMFCWVTYIQWQTSISNYMHQLGFPLSAYSALWTINGLLILFGQPLIQWFMARLKRPVKWQLLFGVIFFMLTFALLSHSQSYGGFVTGMVIMTIGEILIFPAVPAIADRLAPLNRRGMYQGLVSGAANVGRTIGPFLGGLLYDGFGSLVLLYSCIFICGFALICFGTYQRLQYTQKEISTVKVHK